ncbi:MAG: hypothetical protein RL699_1308 [Bacteroidota bacterium]
MSLGFVGFAQNQLDAFSSLDQVKSVVVNKKMFELMAKVKMDESDKEAARYLTIIKNLTQLTLYSTSDKPTAAQMKTTVARYAADNTLTEMSRFSENGKQISLFVKPGASVQFLSEILLFVESSTSEETVLFSLRGTIDLNEVAFLSERLKLPGKEAIQKAVKGSK